MRLVFGASRSSRFGGVAMGGVSLAWNLWVTKISPPGRESEYMGVQVIHWNSRGDRPSGYAWCSIWISPEYPYFRGFYSLRHTFWNWLWLSLIFRFKLKDWKILLPALASYSI